MTGPKGWLASLFLVLAIAGVLVWVGEASADGIEIKIDESVSPVGVEVEDVSSSRVTVIRAGEITTVAVSGFTSDPLGISRPHAAVFIEAGTTSTISDIVLASFSAGTLTVTLTSNTNGTALTGPTGAVSFQEIADLQTVLSNGSDDNEFRIKVKSEVTEVPEPGTLFLLATGLVGVGAMWRRQNPMPLDASA